MSPVCETTQTIVKSSLLDTIGQTALLRLSQIEQTLVGVELYAKAEWFNPGGSVKDRPAARMICEAISSGRLTAGRRILDATSGNTGIAYAMIGAALGYGVTLCVPGNITAERKRILRAYGPEVIFTDPLVGSVGAIREARRRYAENPDRYFYPDQYNNEFNWRAHYDTTAPEIWKQTDGRVTHFVAGLGTSGTFVGAGRRLRELNPDITLVSVQPDAPFHGLEGLKHMETAIVPGIYEPTLADLNLGVSTDDAYAMTRRLARDEGLLAGISSGAALAGALQMLQMPRLKPGPAGQWASRVSDGPGPSRQESAAGPGFSRGKAVVVIVFPDGGERYLSESFWTETDA
jgi:cysteine synthase B